MPKKIRRKRTLNSKDIDKVFICCSNEGRIISYEYITAINEDNTYDANLWWHTSQMQKSNGAQAKQLHWNNKRVYFTPMNRLAQLIIFGKIYGS